MKTHSGRLYTCEMHIQSAEAQKYAKSRLSGMLSIPEFTEKDFLFLEFQIWTSKLQLVCD